MAAAGSIDVICIECGQYMRSEEDLRRHMDTVHESAGQNKERKTLAEQQNTTINNMMDDGANSNSALNMTATNPASTLPIFPQLGELDGAACCRFLTELFAIIKPAHQSAAPNHFLFGSPPFSYLANAAVIELLKKQLLQPSTKFDGSLLSQSTLFDGSQPSSSTSSVPSNSTQDSCSPASPRYRNDSGNSLDAPRPSLNASTPDSVTTSSADVSSFPSTSSGAKADVNRTTAKSERRYTCEYCGKQFAQAPTLIAHRRIHTGEKPYKCHICNAAFKQVTHRNDHVNSHDPDYRPFIFQECGRGFARKYSLSIHTLIHKGIYRFQCSYCDKKFRQSADKKKHELRHTRVK